MDLLSLRLNYSTVIHSSHVFNNSPIRLSSSSSGGGREASFNSAKLSSFSTVYEEGDSSQKDLRALSCLSSALETLDNDSLERDEIKVKKGKRLLSSVHDMLHNKQVPFGDEISTASMKYQSFKAIHFRLLMENLGTLEETFADSEVIKLKNDITLQLGKLGVLEYFDACLSRSLEPSRTVDFVDERPGQVEEQKKNRKVDKSKDKVFVQSTRKKQNKTRSKTAFTDMEVQSLPSEANQEYLLCSSPSSMKRGTNCKNRRTVIARREAEMSRAVKVLAELEKIREAIEEDTEQVASLSSWAEACGVDEKVLYQRLHYGRYCRDELIRSTRSLVLYLARKYRGLGIALEDLVQAGYIGVLQGAERFDITRGYRFSTYVQYWIRKSLSRMVTRYARGIAIPWSLNRAINQIQKAQKSLKSTSMKSPDDKEIAKITGLSLDKITSARNCLRVVASTDQKIGEWPSVKYAEFMPDTTIDCPEEAAMKQNMRKDIYDLLKSLDSRESQVITLRFGLGDHKPRSLEEIGKHFNVSKEWVRRIEKKALTKLRNRTDISNLSFYLNLDL